MGKRLQDPKGEKVKETVDRCDLCGGELKPGKTTLEIWREEYQRHRPERYLAVPQYSAVQAMGG